MDCLEAADLSLSYEGGLKICLPRLRLERGQPAALVGASGSGKSTLLECLGLLNARAHFGEYRLGELRLDKLDAQAQKSFRTSHIGFMPQSGGLIAFLTLEENIRLQLKLAFRGREDQKKIVKCYAQAEEIAATLGVRDLFSRYPRELSLGQRQRAVFCRTVCFAPQLILIDEPTAALDPKNAELLFAEISRLCAVLEAFVLVVTHDVRRAASLPAIIAWSEEHSTAQESVFVQEDLSCS